MRGDKIKIISARKAISAERRLTIAGETVIHCEPERYAIGEAIQKALDASFREEIKDAGNPYGDGHTSEKILGIIKDFLVNDRIDIKKKFFDIPFEI